jgi:hypothetical protein
MYWCFNERDHTLSTIPRVYAQVTHNGGR